MKKFLFFAVALFCAAGVVGCSDDDTDGLLSVPSEVKCVARNDAALSFVWNAVEGAKDYHYQFTTGDGRTLFTNTVAEPQVTVSGLEPSTSYCFRVQACGASGIASEYSAFLTAETLAPGQSEKAGLDVPVPQLTAATASSVTLEWNKVANAAKYAYRLTKAADETLVKSDETAELSVEIGALEEAVEYRFAVQALAGDSELYSDSEYSEELAVKTVSETVTPDPGAPVAFKFPASEQDGVIRAFPGAEGAGMYTTGGRGGKVYHVTTLEDDENNKGSIRWIVQKCNEPRIVVFDVAGTIELKSDLKINTGNISILGQTAPGDGICLKNYQLGISSDNVIIRYMRFRPGEESANDGLDAIGSRGHKNIIIDHCSMSWSTDECASFYVMKNMTMQWCLMYESLRNGGHEKGSHGYGGIWGGAPASFHHNVLAHHDSRNPRFDGPEQYADQEQGGADAKVNNILSTDRLLDFRNNVVYNFCNYGGYGGVGITMNYIGNYYKWGPASYYGCGPSYKAGVESANKAVRRKYFVMTDNYYSGNNLAVPVQGNPTIYVGDNTNNVFDTSIAAAAGDNTNNVGPAITADNKSGMTSGTVSPTLAFNFTWSPTQHAVLADGKACAVTTHSAQTAFNKIIDHCGASLRMDTADKRVLQDVKNGTGTSGEAGGTNPNGLKKSWYGIIDYPSDKGGYPVLTATQEEIDRIKDTDGDGIPDHYETLFGLDPANAADAALKTLDPQQLYTNFEVYAHYLVQDIVEAQNADGSYTSLQ
ncbi:MAG: pectate lyase [Alistipes sp.]|nr:pectate lyase [Alistipes sp.]